jgi:hypothetical protein
MFPVNVRSMHVLPRVVGAELMQSKLNVDFIKFTNDLFCITNCNAHTIHIALLFPVSYRGPNSRHKNV